MIYMTVGVGDPPAAARAQDPNDLAGKVLRLRDDGTVPPDNPFVGRTGFRPEIYTMGHRNALGLAVHPDTGAIWECEDGPNGGDEINVLQPGKNYGWPVRQLRPVLSRTARTGKTLAGRNGTAPCFLGSGDRDFGNDVLHRRQVSQLEE